MITVRFFRPKCVICLIYMGVLFATVNVVLFQVRWSGYKAENIDILTWGRELVTKKQNYSQEAITLQEENEFATDWMEVKLSNRKVFIYSAYYDTRQSHSISVRIISILQRGFKVKECEIFTSQNTIVQTPAKTTVIREGWNLAFSASFITCEYTPNAEEVPLYVWPKIPQTTELGSALQVVQMQNRKPEGYLSVCVKPFHYDFNRAVWLVEFIEMYLVLGASHFIFYNHTVGRDVEKVLEHYIAEGVATLYQWSLPIISQKEIRTEGIFAALNDCNLRSVNRFKYTAFVDIDEFIFPRKHKNFNDLFLALGDFNAYIFMNGFFYLYWGNDTKADGLIYGTKNNLAENPYGNISGGPYLLTAYKTTRLSEPHPHGKRSKYIGKPDKIIECGNHIVGQYVPQIGEFGLFKSENFNFINVKAEDALLHHYRICEFGGFDCLNANHEIDRTAHQWLETLFKNVAYNCGHIFLELGTCPAAPPLGSPW